MDKIVVVGAGLGGVTTVKALRGREYGGEIVVIGDETHPAYDRPPLSKDVLLGMVDHPALPVDWSELDVDLRLGRLATDLEIDDLACTVHLDDGSAVPADSVLAATGSRPVELPCLGAHPHVCLLRTLDDALRLRGELRGHLDVVVLGAGWIGAEVASSAASLGCAVTVVEAENTPLSRALGPDVGVQLAAWYSESGVALLLGRRVVGAGMNEVELDDGERLRADVVVVGVGVTPATDWLTRSGIELDGRGAVAVDSNLRSSTTHRVYAIGDCASYPSRRYGKRLRPEHWTNAQQAATVVAANVLGGSVSYDPVPYFWSKQFDRMLQYAGHHEPDDELVWRGDPSDRRWSVCWLKNGQPTAVFAVNRPRDIANARRLLYQGATFDVALLTDPANSLAECIA